MSEDRLLKASGGEIPPFRMAQLIKVSSKMADLAVNGVWQLSYEELDIVLDLIRRAAEQSREKE